MNSEFVITVKDVLKRPLFYKARVVAGEGGLDKRVRWAHILEISNFDSLIHGGEMILTTGIGLQLNVASKISFLEKLIDYGVSCLCIELGNYFGSVPQDMLEIANKNDFPIIVFEDIVRFIDITQDLHGLIINHHYEMLEGLEKISRQFNQLSLTSQGVQNILKLLSVSTKTQVVYLPNSGKPQFYPFMEKHRLEEIQKIINQHDKQSEQLFQWNDEKQHLLIQSVNAMGKTWGFIAIILNGKEPEKSHLFILDRASLALAQDLLRKRYIEEKKLHAEQLWVNDLIYNRIKSEDQVKSLLGFEISKSFEYRVCVIEIKSVNFTEKEEMESTKLHISLLARSVFEQYGFHTIMTSNSNQLIIVAFDMRYEKFDTHRFEKILNHLKLINKNMENEEIYLYFAVGGPYQKLTDAHLSYEEAQYIFKIRNIGYKNNDLFFEELGIFRLLLSIDNTDILHKFVQDYLGPVIEHDKNKDGKLLLTLKVYLENGGSMQNTSKQLFIVRQTLYHRLEKIKKLLGDHFMDTEKRLSIEVAIFAYKLLFPNNTLLDNK